MNTFPLIRTKKTNEHIISALFLVLILYHLPIWVKDPSHILNFLVLTIFGLVMDAAANILRYKRLWCCVSAAVTAGIISLLTTGIPLWEQLIGLAAALIFGKYIWGGTGKNKINPAMAGLLIILIFWNVPYPFFKPSYLLIPAILLSLPFLKLRPFAGIGFIVGTIAALFINHDLSIVNLLSCGTFFWGCIILTDPVTVTGNRIIGLCLGFFGGLAALLISPGALIFTAVIFIINVVSYVIHEFINIKSQVKPRCNIPKVFTYKKGSMLDLSEEKVFSENIKTDMKNLSPEDIIRIIKDCEVYGMGGAAYPTYKKIASVCSNPAKKKYLIINAAECDPGLIHDNYILDEHLDEVKKGIDVLKSCTKFSSVHIAVKTKETLDLPEDINLHILPDKYPVGAEKILIHEVLNRKLENNEIPAECGILVLNLQTVYSIYKAIYLNNPADTKFLTVADMKTMTAKVVKVSLGMKLKDIMEAVYPGSRMIFTGGGIMQVQYTEEEDTVNKNTNFIATGTIPQYKESPQCSQCGNCIAHCPVGLKVNRIADLVDQDRMKDALKYNPSACISCGSCSYSCLAGRNLAKKVKKAKSASV